MKVGFTGTRHGMTPGQKERLRAFLIEVAATEIHHGCALGSDIQCHEEIAPTIPTIKDVYVHPPNDVRSATLPHVYGLKMHVLSPRKALERNMDIVDDTEILVGTPLGFHEELRSGTWHALRYGYSKYHKIHIIYPDGNIYMVQRSHDEPPPRRY